MLNEFVLENDNLGRSGFFVPLTDYSDRLDTMVEGLITEINDRTHLLLLVGIGGTLFGLFEFAVRSAAALQMGGPGQIANINRALAESIGKAFPVGFFGLMLMLLFQVASAGPDSKLRRALAAATNRALTYRQAVSRNEAGVVLEAAERIERSLKSLENLDQTLSDQLTPVIDKLGERLDAALELIRSQTEKTKQSTVTFEQAATKLQQSTEKVLDTTRALHQMLESAPAVFQGSLDLQRTLQESTNTITREASAVLQESRSSIEAAATAVENLLRTAQVVIDQTSALPREIVTVVEKEATSAYEKMTKQSLTSWEATLEKFAKAVDAQLADSRRGIVDAGNALEKAAGIWDAIGSNMETHLRKPFETPLTKMLGKVEEMRGNLAAALRQFDETVTKYPELRGDIIALGTALREATQLLRSAPEQVIGREMRTRFDNLQHEVSVMNKRVEQSIRMPGRGEAGVTNATHEKNTGGWFARLFRGRRN